MSEESFIIQAHKLKGKGRRKFRVLSETNSTVDLKLYLDEANVALIQEGLYLSGCGNLTIVDLETSTLWVE